MVVESGFPQMCHKASLPWCYYDKNTKKVILRLVASPDVSAISVIYGDPFQYVKNGGEKSGGGGASVGSIRNLRQNYSFRVRELRQGFGVSRWMSLPDGG
jgi:hypothetical protein